MTIRPTVIVIAGPNGAGKSTAAPQILPETVRFLNADEVAKTLPTYPSPAADRWAGRIILGAMDDLEDRRSSFAVETTLASRSLAPRMVRLKAEGYVFRLYFLWTPSPEFSIERVAERVRRGGHSIPEETIRRRYRSGLDNFFRLYRPLADFWMMIENTSMAKYRRIARGGIGRDDEITDHSLWEIIPKGIQRESP